MPDLVTQKVSENVEDQVDEILAEAKERRNKRKHRIEKIKAAKKDLTNLTSMASDAFSEIVDALGDDAPGWLENTSNFLKNSTDVLEKTSVIIGMTKSAGVVFWLALVQVLVDEAKTSIENQIKYLDQMRAILNEFKRNVKRIANLLLGSDSPEALKFAHDQVGKAEAKLVAARKVYSGRGGGVAVSNLADQSVEDLKIAERRLSKDIDQFNEIPSLQQFRELSTFIEAMYPALMKIAGDYAVECIKMSMVIKQILNIDKAVRSNIDLIDRKLTLKMIDKMINSIRKNTKQPLGDVLRGWEVSPPSQSAIVWNEMKYRATIQSNYRKIRSYFNNDFSNLSKLEIASDAYKHLVEDLKNEDYVTRSLKLNPEKAKSVAVRVGAPSLNLFSIGQRSSTAMEAMVSKNEEIILTLAEGAENTMNTLSKYGPYKSTFLDYVNNSLKALGYEGEPINKFATGDLIKIPKFSAGIPEVKGVVSSGSTITAGIAFYVGKALGSSVKTKTVSDALNRTVDLERKNKKRFNRKQKHNVEQVMDDAISEDAEVIAQMDEEMDAIECGMKGELPKTWSPDNLGGFA